MGGSTNPSSPGSKDKNGGGNPVRWTPTPSWQKGMDFGVLGDVRRAVCRSLILNGLCEHESGISVRDRGRGTGGGGALGASALPLFVPGEKLPFSGIKVPYFHGIEVPFLQNLSALFGQCPLTFEVLPRPLVRDNQDEVKVVIIHLMSAPERNSSSSSFLRISMFPERKSRKKIRELKMGTRTSKTT